MTTILSEEEFNTQVVLKYTDVIGEKLGGSVEACSDEWFAAAANLIKPKAPVRDATRFTHAGAWYDGWETRRHNSEPADWVVVKAGVARASIVGCEVDTAFFNGNHAPHISVEGADFSTAAAPADWASAAVAWEPVMAKTECGPSQRHFFVRPQGATARSYTHFRLRMYPDGGIARFRLYGEVHAVMPADPRTVVDFALVKNGGVAVRVSDQHFGSADNLLLPGRGHDMSDGWETKRSRAAGHVDWVVIRLGAPTVIRDIVVDTAHFRGNFPQKINVKGFRGPEAPAHDSDAWCVLVGDSKTGPDAEHRYDVREPAPFTHVLLTIIPDGGVKRVRVHGCVAEE
ncbi:Allantoicase [Metschnikowia bicuspidata var. bicuspidata NRRL YB-4993]|uniref:allantoicase n=1 Tax=Metschnikowia bicuspidata var. bicuspidata NRRL YB-4993 TaxID=869754 RepID=A0A1A0HAN2_9ASCO|nr:Allantoicase [Metschnikowia bicuspidata var. bicuspidata NRRL YB-4993]OBA21060.1 Allantoicase [Metschnikowia bicuspidata var. bicuspidata NRRL YB-4993]